MTKKITRAKTLGQTLKTARIKKELTIEQVEKETTICAKYLIALEEGNFDQLPAEAYNIGFVRLYAGYLKLNVEKVIQLYRQERSAVRLAPIGGKVNFTPRKIREWNFLVTPKLLATLGTLVLVGSVIGYIGYQLNLYNQPPKLEINNGQTEFTSAIDIVTISGLTAEGATVTLNAETIAVDLNGRFAETVQLRPGLNEFVVLARNRVAKESKEMVKILYDPSLARIE